MTVNAVGPALGFLSVDIDEFLHEFLVALRAVLLQHATIARLDANGFVKVLEREALGVPEAVLRLAGVFAREIVRRVTVVAGGDGVMARLLPAVVMFTHDVAIGARGGIIAEIRTTLAIPEGVPSEAETDTNENT